MSPILYQHKNGIGLRKVEASDLDALQALKAESWFGTHRVAIVNAADQRRWFERQAGSTTDLVLIAEDEHDPGPVGIYKIAGIDWISRSYQSAHDVFAHARGQGLGKTVLEAGVDFGFEVLGMHRLDTEVLENNIAAMKTALFAGFKEEGCRRGAVYKCGSWLDSITMGLLRGEWQELERVRAYRGICNKSYKPKDGRD